MLERYQYKIKTAEEVRNAVGKRPRERKVIMCHGVFDIVHPGHLRHLLYAKQKADLLVTSLTADRHITKGAYRPHVSQGLRALNLAALEMVDFVILDDQATPLENIRLIEPDYFAKGFEYGSGRMAAATLEEQAALKSYGGEIIFTPGDVVYSSSALLRESVPDIRYANLQLALEQVGGGFDYLREVLADRAPRRVHVVGDLIVDSLSYSSVIGGPNKTPTLSVALEKRVDYVGGAGVVAKHFAAAGAEVIFSTVVGNDDFGRFAIDDLKAAGVQVSPVVDLTRPTVQKNAIIAGGYRLLKIDVLDNSSISPDILEALRREIAETSVDAVVFSDFRHGIFNRRTIDALTAAIPEGVFRVADSQVASRWGNITDFKGFDLITPNEKEARFALGDQDSGIRPLASALYDAAQCKMLILKLGERGVLACCNSDHESLDSFFAIDSFADRVVDPVGAGDALLAYSTLALMRMFGGRAATILGVLAASCACEIDGNQPITAELVRAKIDSVERELCEP